jgi:hypothetical protein
MDKATRNLIGWGVLLLMINMDLNAPTSIGLVKGIQMIFFTIIVFGFIWSWRGVS